MSSREYDSVEPGGALNGTYLAEKGFAEVERWRRASSRMLSSVRVGFTVGGEDEEAPLLLPSVEERVT